ASTIPRMPCSGLKRAMICTPEAWCIRSMVVRPSLATPVLLVTRPTFRPLRRGEVSSGQKSHPPLEPPQAGLGRRARPAGHFAAQIEELALAVRMHAIAQDDHGCLARRVYPDAGAGEARMAKAHTGREYLAAIA